MDMNKFAMLKAIVPQKDYVSIPMLKSELNVSDIEAEEMINKLAQAGAVVYLTAMQAQLVGESEYNTYYAGSSFKVVYEKDGNKETTLWNQYGLLTSVKSGSDSLKVSYKK